MMANADQGKLLVGRVANDTRKFESCPPHYPALSRGPWCWKGLYFFLAKTINTFRITYYPMVERTAEGYKIRVKLSTSGMVTIPAKIRELVGKKPGNMIELVVLDRAKVEG
jgi:AbrB family looped-hinge helix DNA binding protein